MLTIDGPAGTGKSVTARALAPLLGLHYLDSGAFYRAIALAAEREGLTGPGDPSLTAFLEKLPLKAERRQDGFALFLGEEDVTGLIRGEETGVQASELATAPAVRDRVREYLMDLASSYPCVAEGRDMGSTVFPDAGLKIYLTATSRARVERRIAQLRERGEECDPAQVEIEMAARDARDSGRSVSPLRIPEGSLVLDSTALSLEAQIDLIAQLYRGGGRLKGSLFYRFVVSSVRIFYLAILGVRAKRPFKLPPGACLIASNHQSNHDPPLVASVMPGATTIMAKQELFKPPVFGPMIRALGAIPVRRGQLDREALRQCLGALRSAKPLLIFPQGTRVREPGEGRTHTGVAWLARNAGVPVVPVNVSGRQWLRSFLRIERVCVRVGEPLRPLEGATREDDAAFAEAVMTAIRELAPRR